MAYLRGEEGKTLTFFVLRQVQGSWRSIRVDVVPGPYTTYSVFGTVSETDPTVGIVTVTGFDMETPTQFDRTMGALLEAGCTRFVFDLRNNPGGNLRSIVAVLARLLQEGDRILTMTDADGTVTWEECRVDRQTGSYAGCSVTREDIGKYRGYACAVVTNRGTASAAEVFTACLRDYDLAVTVGETTYGKGCMQTTINLKPYGLEGALKLTDRYYTPPCGESYEGIGIQPDLPVEDDTARYERPAVLQTEADDPQLYAAVDAVRNGN
jgi:carboxyl-terminal processing protease